MTCQELIDVLVAATHHYGDIPVQVHVSDILRFEVQTALPCNEKDHILLVLGERAPQ